MVIKSPNLSTLEEEESLSGSFCYTSDAGRYQEWMRSSDSGCQCACDSSTSECSDFRATSSCSRVSSTRRSACSPVGEWLAHIRDWTEVESLSALQAKSVAVNEESFEALSVRNAQVAVKKTRSESLVILHQIEDLMSQLPLTTDDLPSFKAQLDQVTLAIHSLVQHCRRRGCDHIQTPVKQTKHASADVAVHGMQICKFLDDFSRRKNVNNAQLEASLRRMHERLRQVSEATIRKDVDIIRQALRFVWGSICSKWALLAVWQLTQKDDFVSSIFLEDGFMVRRLMSLACIRSPNLNANLAASGLRILTHMSDVGDCVRQIFEQPPGADLVTVLSYEKSELVLMEAVGLVVQVTMPLIDCKKRMKEKVRTEDERSRSLDHLIKVMPVSELVKALTSLARVCHSQQLLHLISASLANISFLDPSSLVQQETCANLMNTVRNRFPDSDDVYLKDQIVTILANVSSVSPLEVVSSGGLVFLISCLEMRSPSAAGQQEDRRRAEEGDEEDEKSLAVERMQQKVAAAVARLASNKSCAALLLRLNGVRRLAHLCQDERERNFSETVLLASLAALRRIAATTGIQPFKQMGVDHLVTLSLKDAYVKCQSVGESYV